MSALGILCLCFAFLFAFPWSTICDPGGGTTEESFLPLRRPADGLVTCAVGAIPAESHRVSRLRCANACTNVAGCDWFNYFDDQNLCQLFNTQSKNISTRVPNCCFFLVCNLSSDDCFAHSLSQMKSKKLSKNCARLRTGAIACKFHVRLRKFGTDRNARIRLLPSCENCTLPTTATRYTCEC